MRIDFKKWVLAVWPDVVAKKMPRSGMWRVMGHYCGSEADAWAEAWRHEVRPLVRQTLEQWKSWRDFPPRPVWRPGLAERPAPLRPPQLDRSSLTLSVESAEGGLEFEEDIEAPRGASRSGWGRMWTLHAAVIKLEESFEGNKSYED